MLENWPKPLVIGHRGASTHAPENTSAAFELAITHRADAIEFDVSLSSDRQVMVIHDTTVDRTTNGKGKVAHLSFSELQKLDAGYKFSEAFAGEKIPSLIDVFERFGTRILMNIELKNYSTPFDGLVKIVVNLVKSYKLENRIIFSSFLSNNLNIARKLLPEVPCALLADSGWKGYIQRRYGWKKKYQALHPYVTDVDEKLVRDIHGENKRVHVWTVNEEDDLKRMLDLQVDGVFTDDPAMLRRMMEQHE
jgi:glycerophosphoryl diester phosphodiesterase